MSAADPQRAETPAGSERAGSQEERSGGGGVKYHRVEGLLVPVVFHPDHVRAAMDYRPRDDDVIIATYPKCGTTWTQYIVSLIFRKGRPFRDAVEFFRSTPFFEMLGPDWVDRMERPGAIKIHLPQSHLRHWSPKAKYIYVARNPKDCLVSLYHHTRMFRTYDFQEGNFSRFFDLFLAGEVEDNDYLDHLKGWYEKRNEPNVLFLTYEAMKANTRKAVMDIAKFLGTDYWRALQDDEQYLANVLRYSSFEYMKDHTNDIWGYLLEPDFHPDKLEELCKRGPPRIKATFCRKGVVGDWKGHLTTEQAKALDSKYRVEDLLQLWDTCWSSSVDSRPGQLHQGS